MDLHSGSPTYKKLKTRFLLTCTGTCLPGYHFQGEEDKISITLECHGNSWRPRRSFPPCESGGYCGLTIRGAGHYNCTTSTDGTRCDITCGSRKAGRYRCYPGRDWNPQLPSCAIPKEADKIGLLTRCLCQNGGTCVEGGRCICPSGTTGSFCEAESESTGRDCNLQITGVGAYNCTISSGGTACDITCDNVPHGRYHCRSGKEWRPQLPYCTTAKGTRTSRQTTCHCENGGSCDGRGNCICPSGFTGSRCENGRTSNCPDPGAIQFGYRRFRNRTPAQSSRTYSTGQSFQYYCNQGYELRGNNVLNCLPSGRWSSSLPRCENTQIEPTVYCSDPGRISFGSYLNSDGNSATSQQYTVGQSVNYYCQNGFGLTGTSVVTCLPSGSWSIKPLCRRVITPFMPTEDKPQLSKYSTISQNAVACHENCKRVCPLSFAIVTSRWKEATTVKLFNNFQNLARLTSGHLKTLALVYDDLLKRPDFVLEVMKANDPDLIQIRRIRKKKNNSFQNIFCGHEAHEKCTTPPHLTRAVRELFDQVFPERWIGHGGAMLRLRDRPPLFRWIPS
ncbi:hypothetical protein AVEN_197509-1 [Araneus ventricosus]|uniref:Sushi, von Willebrand factor type A, EGF and pentraxin domain-containing protein 1 n=1 Tax=Araneus ventricosus TaxID=182803 RepID=A0A4Y2BUN3_ARAVE|nr:hypothetical protein AVEN_197509-1 [Araneus ventricosus]